MLALLGAGCFGDSGGSASVSYSGTGNGTDNDSTECDAEGNLIASGKVDAGQVNVRVTDGDGVEKYSKTFDGGSNFDSASFEGASGTWRIVALRTSDSVLGSPFSGNYEFKLAC